MTYAAGASIDASDYNTLIGPSTTANTLNYVWATGTGSAGYGQTALANVTAGNPVQATEWANLVNRTSNAATHQGSSITSVTAPVAGGSIVALTAIPTNLQTISTNRLNAATQSSTTANTATTVATWTDRATFTHTVTFANGDAARYFFNCGGQLALTVSHSNVTAGINLAFNQLASNVGTVVLSAMSSGTATIVGTTYNGVTKVGGGGSTPTVATNSGYFAWTTANANVFSQTVSTGPAGYTSTNISVLVRTNGAQGSLGDVGNVITISTIWDEVPNGLTVGTGSSTTLTVRPPEVTNIANSWGTITLTGTVAVV